MGIYHIFRLAAVLAYVLDANALAGPVALVTQGDLNTISEHQPNPVVLTRDTTLPTKNLVPRQIFGLGKKKKKKSSKDKKKGKVEVAGPQPEPRWEYSPNWLWLTSTPLQKGYPGRSYCRTVRSTDYHYKIICGMVVATPSRVVGVRGLLHWDAIMIDIRYYELEGQKYVTMNPPVPFDANRLRGSGTVYIPGYIGCSGRAWPTDHDTFRLAAESIVAEHPIYDIRGHQACVVRFGGRVVQGQNCHGFVRLLWRRVRWRASARQKNTANWGVLRDPSETSSIGYRPRNALGGLVDMGPDNEDIEAQMSLEDEEDRLPEDDWEHGLAGGYMVDFGNQEGEEDDDDDDDDDNSEGGNYWNGRDWGGGGGAGGEGGHYYGGGGGQVQYAAPLRVVNQ